MILTDKTISLQKSGRGILMYKNTVLVVDDQPLINVMLKEVLSNSGFNTFVASNYIEAVEIAKTEQPDVAILDINLPDIDGIELLSKLKEINPDIKAIFISGSFDPQYAQKAADKGVLRYFIKPFDVFELANFLVKISSVDSASKGENKWQMIGKK